jgi:hypothetical protein
MKTILLSLFLFVLSSAAFAQIPTVATPFKGANTVCVQTPDSAVQALRKLATILVAQGYTIAKVDTEYLTLRTDPRTTPGYSTLLTLKATASPGAASLLAISGEMVVNTMNYTANNTMQYGGSGFWKATFQEAESAARKYPGGAVAYYRR